MILNNLGIEKVNVSRCGRDIDKKKKTFTKRGILNVLFKDDPLFGYK